MATCEHGSVGRYCPHCDDWPATPPQASQWEVVPSDDGADDSWGIRRAGEQQGMSVAQMLWKHDAILIVDLYNNQAEKPQASRAVEEAREKARQSGYALRFMQLDTEAEFDAKFDQFSRDLDALITAADARGREQEAREAAIERAEIGKRHQEAVERAFTAEEKLEAQAQEIARLEDRLGTQDGLVALLRQRAEAAEARGREEPINLLRELREWSRSEYQNNKELDKRVDEFLKRHPLTTQRNGE